MQRVIESTAVHEAVVVKSTGVDSGYKSGQACFTRSSTFKIPGTLVEKCWREFVSREDKTMHGRESRGILWFLFCIFQRHTQQWRQFNIFSWFGGSWLGAHGRKWCIELRPRLLATYPTASDEDITNEPAKTLCNEMWTASFQMLLWKPEVVILDIKTNDFIWVINEIINAQILPVFSLVSSQSCVSTAIWNYFFSSS